MHRPLKLKTCSTSLPCSSRPTCRRCLLESRKGFFLKPIILYPKTCLNYFPIAFIVRNNSSNQGSIIFHFLFSKDFTKLSIVFFHQDFCPLFLFSDQLADPVSSGMQSKLNRFGISTEGEPFSKTKLPLLQGLYPIWNLKMNRWQPCSLFSLHRKRNQVGLNRGLGQGDPCSDYF